MVWTHKSIGRAPTHSVTNSRVLRGSTIIAWLVPVLQGRFDVNTVGGDYIGTADSPAHAMLMAIRHDDGRRK